MNLVETHLIRKSKETESLYKIVDELCYKSKNLYNATQYLIKQCFNIRYQLQKGEVLDRFQSKLNYDINQAIKEYLKNPNHKMSYLTSKSNSVINYYFFSLVFEKFKRI